MGSRQQNTDSTLRFWRGDLCRVGIAAMALWGCSSAHGSASLTAADAQSDMLGGSADCAEPEDCDSALETGERTPLPRYFSLHLDGTQTSVGGEPLNAKQLTERIRTEAADSRNSGATVLLGKEFSGEVLGALVWELSGAGFEHIVVSRVPVGGSVIAEPEVTESPSKESEQDIPIKNPVATKVEEPPAQVDESSETDDVVVKPMGLHIGGGPNDDATKRLYSEPIARYFPQLQRCHRSAENRDVKASVGVDLLIPGEGGRAKVKDFRSAIRGDDFKKCVTKVFGKVKFPAGDRATMISYSVLFKPQ